MKKIGIIGGMGPETTANFYLEIIRIFQKEYGSVKDKDSPEMYICNLPIQDVVAGIEKIKDTEKMLCDAARKFETVVLISYAYHAIQCRRLLTASANLYLFLL